MNKIIRKSGLGEIGENKLRHKIEITLFTEITVLKSCLQVTTGRNRTCAGDAYDNWWNTAYIVKNKNSNILCLVERLTSTTQFSDMKDPKTLPFLYYQVNLIPGGPVTSVRNKTQLVSLLDTIHSHCIPRGQKPCSPGNWLVIFSLWKKKKSESAFFFFFSQTGKKMHSASTSNWSWSKGWEF